MRRLIDAEMIVDGTDFTFQSRTEINSRDEKRPLHQWVAVERPDRGRARWQNKASAPLIWEADRQEYTPSGLGQVDGSSPPLDQRGVWGHKIGGSIPKAGT